MKITDTGTKSLSDFEVLTFIKAQRAAHASEAKSGTKFKRPVNLTRALERHQGHLEEAERPFVNNENYDEGGNYIIRLMETLEPKVQLTKPELLMLVNHRPHKKELLLPLIEDVESRYSEEEQDWIVEQVVAVLGEPEPQAVEGGEGEDTSMADA